MKIEYYNKEKHYNEICEWWKQHNHSIIDSSCLPITGVMVTKDNNNIACSFLYVMDGCDVCQIAWTTTNPKASSKDRYEGIQLSIDGVLNIAKRLNKNLIMSFVANDTLSNIMENNNFIKNDSHILLTGRL